MIGKITIYEKNVKMQVLLNDNSFCANCAITRNV